MFDNVLVGVDGRTSGRDAIALAQRLAGRDARLTLANVHPGALRVTRAATPARLRDEQQESIRLLEQERAQAGATAELVSVCAQSPGRGLHEQAERVGADLLVVGSCGHGRIGRAMLGSDTRSSLDGAPCAVAVAPHGYAQRAQALDTVGVGYDDSPESKAALELAKQIAAAHGAELLAREVVALPSYSYAGLMTPALGESIDLILEQENQHMRQLPDVEGDAVYGLAGEELAAFGDGLDLLVVGSRGYGPVRRMILGSTSSYLASHARCALLVLPRVAAAPATGADGGRSAAGAMAGTVA